MTEFECPVCKGKKNARNLLCLDCWHRVPPALQREQTETIFWVARGSWQDRLADLRQRIFAAVKEDRREEARREEESAKQTGKLAEAEWNRLSYMRMHPVGRREYP